ncbi:MAG: hypothetical protein LBB44_05200 [Endomicrobium sp.]|nr:hypothetical protein [Endomicrobium sp.]
MAGAELYLNAYSECTAARNRCDAAKVEAGRTAWNNRDDIERFRDTLRKQQEADRICGAVFGICEAERIREQQRAEAEKRREEERKRFAERERELL